ncbi:MAG: hypothetical protein H0T60_17540 [Acidobacteria bacterium]|nr:hypothetical protein [Acidobacteriota bacterium]
MAKSGQAAESGEKTGAATKQAPNVKLAAEAEPLGAGPVTVGMEVICELPGEEEQRAGFHCEAAGRLVALFPGRFKLIEKKGDK